MCKSCGSGEREPRKCFLDELTGWGLGRGRQAGRRDIASVFFACVGEGVEMARVCLPEPVPGDGRTVSTEARGSEDERATSER